MTTYSAHRALCACFLACIFACGGSPSSPDANPPDGAPADGPTACEGCLNAAGECVSGRAQNACGTGGLACDDCGEGQCNDGVCAAAPGCGPDNCSGCCDGDTCVNGNGDEACGAGGLACESCGSGQCELGVCVAPCELTCDGCCDAEGECQASSNPTCGLAGNACVACPGGTQCDAGFCVSASCADTCEGCCDAAGECQSGDDVLSCGSVGALCSACPTGLLCDGSCQPDPRATFRIDIVLAEVSATDQNGDGYDSFADLPDVYAEVRIPSRDPARTPAIRDSTRPMWRGADRQTQTGLTLDALASPVTIRLLDEDTVTSDELIALCTVRFDPRESLQSFVCDAVPSLTTRAILRARVVGE